jgi:hypothetical protein
VEAVPDVSVMPWPAATADPVPEFELPLATVIVRIAVLPIASELAVTGNIEYEVAVP